MNDLTYESRPERVQAWQFTEVGKAPMWIKEAIEAKHLRTDPNTTDVLYLRSRADSLLILLPGLWIVRDAYNGLDGMTDEVFQRRYRRI